MDQFAYFGLSIRWPKLRVNSSQKMVALQHFSVHPANQSFYLDFSVETSACGMFEVTTHSLLNAFLI